jgi:hypothetical protein
MLLSPSLLCPKHNLSLIFLLSSIVHIWKKLSKHPFPEISYMPEKTAYPRYPPLELYYMPEKTAYPKHSSPELLAHA